MVLWIQSIWLTIPLCFYFNVQDVLNSVELEKFKFGTVVFSGNYYDLNDNIYKKNIPFPIINKKWDFGVLTPQS